MSKEKISELRETLFVLEKKIKPLEWDASRNQINEFKKQQLGTLQEQFTSLRDELKKLEEE
jgi:ABC-type phosphate transport system auxiliary subunit